MSFADEKMILTKSSVNMFEMFGVPLKDNINVLYVFYFKK